MEKILIRGDNRKKILIIEDEESVSELVSVILRRRGFGTITAGDGEAGLTSALLNRPNGIVLDLNMPEMGGFAFLTHRLQFEELKDIPVVVLTASRQLEDVERAMALGAAGYVAKPVQAAPLLERLEKLVPSPLYGRPETTVVSWSSGDQQAGDGLQRSRRTTSDRP